MITLDDFVNKFNEWFSVANSVGSVTISDKDLHQIADVLVYLTTDTTQHGEWIKTSYPEVCKCSCCEKPSNISKGIPNYCPNCGARMNKGSKREIGFYKDPKNYNISQRLVERGNK